MATSIRLRRHRSAVVAVVLALVGVLPVAFDLPAGAESSEGATAAVADDQRRISGGGLHTCAVLDTGEVQCWGANANGQLGNDTVSSTTIPKKVNGITTALSVSGGTTHTCALLHGGDVQCWGNNGSGQVGNGLTSPPAPLVLKPATVVDLSDATAVASGGFHTCALRVGGTVACWGADGSGQLGDGGEAGTSYRPVTVTIDTDADPAVEALAPLTGAVAVASGEFHSCALLATGAVRCWGHNGFGQLGNGATLPGTMSTTAVPVSGLPDDDVHAHAPHKALAIAAGDAHTCAVLDDNTVRCWGQAFFGQLGNNASGAGTDKSTPQTVKFDADPSLLAEDLQPVGGVVAITTGQFHTCVRMIDGTARCWGQNGRAQLGDGTTTDKKLAVPVTGLAGARAVSAGGFHTCALVTGNAMKCWGYNFEGQLGSYRDSRVTPDAVTALRGASTVATGDGHACALVTSAEVPPTDRPFCWGSNANGELGAGLSPAATGTTTIPVPVAGILDADAISAGNGHVCALPAGSGTPKCWGRNAQGQLGNGSTTATAQPVAVGGGLTSATRISTGGELDPVTGTEIGHTCAAVSGGSARCWGANGYGQVGDNTTTDRNTPVTVKSDDNNDHLNTPDPAITPPVDITGVTAVAAGGRHSCALMNGGTVRCWGRNFDGQLGDGTNGDRPYAVTVDTDREEPDEDEDPLHFAPLTGAVAVATGARHSCALKSDNTIWCWGRNADGQLGDGTTTSRDVPVKVEGLPLGYKVLAIAAGDNQTCARVLSPPGDNNTTALCWGDNAFGQLGVGGGDRTTPVAPQNLGEPSDDDVNDVEVVKVISGGRKNTCAAIIETTVYCWGDNATAQLGDGVGSMARTPIDVKNLSPVGGNAIPDPADDTATALAPPPAVPVVIAVRSNDSDADGTALTITSVSNPPRGTATHDGATVTYTPDANFCTADPTSNVDTFTYAVTDGTATVPATVTVTVGCPNTAPNAADDTATTNEDTHVIVDVLANDTDINGQAVTLKASSVSDPANGTTAVDPDGRRVRYTPDADFSGTDTFTYKATDGLADSAPATVTITVEPVGDAPVAVDDTASTDEDTAVTFEVLANDTDIDGPSLAIVGVSDPAHGSAAIASASTVTYTPDPGYCLTDGFTYTVSDGTSTDVGNVAMTVNCTNDGPQAMDDAATTAEDTVVTVAVLANDTDPEGDALTVSSVTPAPAHGTAVIDAGNTTITYTPAKDFCGIDTFGYTATDGTDSDAAMVVPVTVLCTNDPPVANDDAASTAEDKPADLVVLANDTDPDGNGLTVTSATDPGHGTTIVRSTNIVSYAPDADFCGTDSFQYSVSDGFGEADTATVTVTVTCTNDAPVVVEVADRSLPWGEQLSAALATTDIDSGDGDPATSDSSTFTMVAGPAGAAVVEGPPGQFSVVWTPTASQVGMHNITVRGTDGNGASDDDTFLVTVTKRATVLSYVGATNGQYSDPVGVAATLTDFDGNPVGNKVVGFTIGSRSAAAPTDATTGTGSATIVLADAAGASSVASTFAGDSAYLPSSTSLSFTIDKELVTTTFTGRHLTTTTGSAAPVQLSATVAEEADGSFGMGGSTLQVTFTQIGGGVLCTGPVSGTSAGQGVATCTTGSLGLGSRAVVAKVTSTRFGGPVDVGAFAVAQSPTGSAAGGGRIGGDDFAFAARPVRRAAPTGDAIHVRRSGGAAVVDSISTLTSLAITCSGGKAKACSSVVEGSPAARWQVDLATGTVTALAGGASLRIEATDAIEPDGAGADRYGVGISPDGYAANALLIAGNIRIVP
jgi:alpha-tubulin suppressor-like RCC1 family protein